MDGANAIQKFLYITLPYLKPMTGYVLLMGIIGTLQGSGLLSPAPGLTPGLTGLVLHFLLYS